MTKLKTGRFYDTNNLEFIRWENEKGDRVEDGVVEYAAWAYFDEVGCYLGPDIDGIEPVFEEA